MPATDALQGAQKILFVDDDALSRKWFALKLGDAFQIETAAGASEALALLARRGGEFAVLVTDYRMPGGDDGLALLQAARRDHRHLVPVLATAYAEKSVAIAAVNQGSVFRILEKPLSGPQTREALSDALASFREKVLERAMNEARVEALRESLGFLAHELNTPLATVRGYASALAARYQDNPGGGDGPGNASFSQSAPGEVLAALASIERRAQYCQSLVSTFVQSARDAFPGAVSQTIRAGALVNELLDEYPFEDDNRSWVSSHVLDDFQLPGRRDLLYLVLCTLTKNALMALRSTPQPVLRIEIGQTEPGHGPVRPCIRFADNGPGIAPQVLARLTHEPFTTRAESGGSGMGLVFCRRVMQSIHGDIAVESDLGRGATVTLYFRPLDSPAP